MNGTKIAKITKTAQYVSGKGIIIKEPKTASSRREVVLSDGIIKILKEWKKVQSIEKFKLGEEWHYGDRVFTMHPDTISSWFVNFMERNNLPRVSLHKLRSGNITLQLYMGVDVKTASVRAGHANVGTTMNIYAYMQKTANYQAASKLDEALL
ncbi:MAG: site-specific integrase [Clostridia bacterium]|nr:site-specific integrase [Clostridia bacterium]